MNHSELLKDILTKAGQIHTEAGTENVSAPCIIVAVAKFCNCKYNGITKYDDLFYPEWYEEERLRYLCKKVLRGSGGLVGHYMKSKLKKDYLQYDTDFLTEFADELTAVMTERNKHTLSADVVFLVALKSLNSEHRFATAEFNADFSVTDALLSVDGNIYGYVLNQIDGVMGKLQAKYDQVKAKMEWKPAAKFAEPEEMLKLLFDSVRTETRERTLKMVLPDFFGKSGELRLVITYSGGVYYVHDDGSALSVLRENTADDNKFSAVFEAISKNLSVKDGKVLGAFCQIFSLFHYLQTLIFVANGDLYYEELDSDGLYADPDIAYVPEEQGEAFDTKNLLEEIKQSVFCGYDEEKGLYLSVDMIYSLGNTMVSYRVETEDDGNLRISDNRKGCFEGEIFESLHSRYDDITPFADLIGRFCKRFGADSDGEDISIAAPVDGFISALFRFINLAVLLSELGRLIEPS